ncbi:RNA polymerase sigma factor [Caulobacter sp. SSI4214]|uniref:RNA polymerase sigma factor n=1 Tax=Caulobacter sp. SSI4214 TaxID=2575739 RepID=UPI00143C47ED|nr:RNA polymerase sigma factor [Caulobacter sp. SSI4214]
MDGSAPPAASSAALIASLDTLFRRYDRWLRGALRRRYGRELADEVAQETYLRAAPYDVAGEVRHPKAFLMRIADNLARDRLRRQRLETEVNGDPAAVPSEPLSPSQDQMLTLKQIVLALPPELRDVFLLNHIQGLTYQEIATLRNIPVTTVHHRMRQALARTAAAMRD